MDVVFNNCADHGFFKELHDRHRVHCPYIFFECKNYSADVGNPEIDQLTSRFSEKSGMFGVLACRTNANQALVQKRCRDIVLKNRGYMLVIDDTDMIAMLRYRAESNESAIDDHMDNLFRRLVL